MRGGGEYDASITAQGKMGPATITLPCLCVCPIAWERGSLCGWVCVWQNMYFWMRQDDALLHGPNRHSTNRQTQQRRFRVCVRLWSLSYTCALIAHASNTKHSPGEEALIKAFALLPSFLPTEGRAETTLAVPV